MSQPLGASISLGDPIDVAAGRSTLSPAKAGMMAFLVSEASFFGTLIMAYEYFLGQTLEGYPTPREVFHLPIVLAASACLFSSSATIHLAEKALWRGRGTVFLRWWGITILLGALFLCGTMWEWSDLIGKWGLSISRNLFGTTYFTLVGFHALHVTIGVIVMSIVFALALSRQITSSNKTVVEVISWYWHFVDGVWLLVFRLVYVAGR
jgi:cytochrome c oxidase subunit 3/cytochrome o ubiquinol oxidase subunit 3